MDFNNKNRKSNIYRRKAKHLDIVRNKPVEFIGGCRFRSIGTDYQRLKDDNVLYRSQQFNDFKRNTGAGV